NDVAEFRRADAAENLPGAIDRTTFARAGEFLFQESVLSPQPPDRRRFTPTSPPTIDPNVRPLGISPDGHRYVRVGWEEDEQTRALIVTDATTGERTIVPIDPMRMRFSQVGLLDP